MIENIPFDLMNPDKDLLNEYQEKLEKALELIKEIKVIISKSERPVREGSKVSKLTSLEVGDCVFLTEPAGRVSVRVNYAYKITGKTFTCRSTNRDGISGTMVCRVS